MVTNSIRSRNHGVLVRYYILWRTADPGAIYPLSWTRKQYRQEQVERYLRGYACVLVLLSQLHVTARRPGACANMGMLIIFSDICLVYF